MRICTCQFESTWTPGKPRGFRQSINFGCQNSITSHTLNCQNALLISVKKYIFLPFIISESRSKTSLQNKYINVPGWVVKSFFIIPWIAWGLWVFTLTGGFACNDHTMYFMSPLMVISRECIISEHIKKQIPVNTY